MPALFGPYDLSIKIVLLQHQRQPLPDYTSATLNQWLCTAAAISPVVLSLATIENVCTNGDADRYTWAEAVTAAMADKSKGCFIHACICIIVGNRMKVQES